MNYKEAKWVWDEVEAGRWSPQTSEEYEILQDANIILTSTEMLLDLKPDELKKLFEEVEKEE